MIQISRLTRPEDTVELLQHVPLPTPELKELFGQQLMSVMTQRPETVFVLQATSDKTGIMGFIIATFGAGEVVNLLQAWVNPQASWDLAKELQSRLMLWTTAHGRSEIEVRTKRSSEALYKRFGFEETAKILTLSIPPEFTQQLLDSLKEPTNG